jgi:hypothetical protein
MLCHVAAWVGVDVGGKRKGFDVAVIDERRVMALQSHLTCTQVVDLAMKHRPAVIAIDSPCCCAPEGRTARDGELQLARTIWLDDLNVMSRKRLKQSKPLKDPGVVSARVNMLCVGRPAEAAIAAAMTARQHSLHLTEMMGRIVVPIGRW